MVKITEKLANFLYKSSTPEKKKICNKVLKNFSKIYFVTSDSNFEFKGSHANLKKSFVCLTKLHYFGRSRIGKICDRFLGLFGKSEKQTFEKRIKLHMDKIVFDEFDDSKSTRPNRSSPKNFSDLVYKLSHYDSFNLSGKTLPTKLKKEFTKLREQFLQAKTKNASERVYAYLKDNSANTLNELSFSEILDNENFDEMFSKQNKTTIDRLYDEVYDFIEKSKEDITNTESIRKKSAEYIEKIGITSKSIDGLSVFANEKALKEGVYEKIIDYLILQHSNSVMIRIHRVVDRILSLFGVSILQRAKRNLNQRTMYSPIYTSLRLCKELNESELCEKMPAFKNLSKWCMKEECNLSKSAIEKIRNCLKDFNKSLAKEGCLLQLSNVKKDTEGNFNVMKKDDKGNFRDFEQGEGEQIFESFFRKQNVVFDKFFTKIKKEAAKN